MNYSIDHFFKYITNKNDQQKFISKFTKQFKYPECPKIHFLHTLHELALGAYLDSSGLKVKHEHSVNLKKPDWSIFDTNCNLIGIVELANLEVDKESAIDIKNQLGTKGHASYWQDAHHNNTKRLYSRVGEKAEKYRRLVSDLNLFYIIAVFTAFEMKVYEDELYPYLFNDPEGIFVKYPEIKAFFLIEENSPYYIFHKYLNPKASIAIKSLVDGLPSNFSEYENKTE